MDVEIEYKNYETTIVRDVENIACPTHAFPFLTLWKTVDSDEKAIYFNKDEIRCFTATGPVEEGEEDRTISQDQMPNMPG